MISTDIDVNEPGEYNPTKETEACDMIKVVIHDSSKDSQTVLFSTYIIVDLFGTYQLYEDVAAYPASKVEIFHH